MPFLDDLQRFGPDSTEAPGPAESARYCAGLAASHYENFSVVTRMTPAPLRPAFAAIYAFCRWSDDLGDELGDPVRSLALLDWWRGELAGLFDGRTPRHPVFVALEPVIADYAIPIGPFDALISAFRQDQEVVDYATYPQLLDYCRRSADPVGHLVLYLARAFNPENARLSDRTCTGLQLANFWQDVARDHAMAVPRVYLPREDRARFGYDDADLAARRFTPAFRELLAFEVERARALLIEGRPLAGRLPGRLGVAVDLFGRGGLAILDRIEAQGYDVWSKRPEVGRWAKLGLLARSILAGPTRASMDKVARTARA